MSDIEWWGYLHANGQMQVKRYWGDPLDLTDAKRSPFVLKVYQPFWARDRNDALRQLAVMRLREIQT